MALWEKVAGLPLTIEDYGLDRLSRDVTSGFTRWTTVLRLHGDGHEGLGEEVSYDAEDQEALNAAGPIQPLAGEWTLETFSAHLATLDLWPEPPRHEPSVQYRVWAYESAALDLALRQNGLSLAGAVGRTARELRFVASIRLGEPATTKPLLEILARVPDLGFKLDPTPSWDDALVAQLVATGAVKTVDLKGLYEGSIVDNPPDPVLYRRVAEAFPEAWIEDPALNDETIPVLEPHAARVTWDAPIHGIADIEAQRWPQKAVNIKPSRFGTVANLFETYEYCEREGIAMYGGGQFELGVGRGQIQYLASLFHPDTPNDVAPAEYHMPSEAEVLPASPLPANIAATGFRRG
ncbi:MAG: hypothetical protein V9E83_01920 [Baekduia sp.]